MEHLEKEIKKVSDTTSKPVHEVVENMIIDIKTHILLEHNKTQHLNYLMMDPNDPLIVDFKKYKSDSI